MAFMTLYAQDGQFVDTSGDTMTGALLLANGSAAAPSLSFANSSTTGLFRYGSNILAIAHGGSNRWYISNGQLGAFNAGGGALLATGASVTAPWVFGSSDTDTGIGGNGSDALSLIAGGVEGVRVTETGTAIASITHAGPTGCDAAQTATITDPDTTFAATRNYVKLSGATAGRTLTTITGGVVGQILVIHFQDGNIGTVTDSTGADCINLSAALASAAGTVLTLVYDGTQWQEVSRSVNG